MDVSSNHWCGFLALVGSHKYRNCCEVRSQENCCNARLWGEVVVFLFVAGWRIEPRALYMLGQCSITELRFHLGTGLSQRLGFLKVGQSCPVENTAVIYDMAEQIAITLGGPGGYLS